MWVVFFFCSGGYSAISLEDESYSEREIALLEFIQNIIIKSKKTVARPKQNTSVSASIKGTLGICRY